MTDQRERGAIDHRRRRGGMMDVRHALDAPEAADQFGVAPRRPRVVEQRVEPRHAVWAAVAAYRLVAVEEKMALGGDDGDQRFCEMPAARRRVGPAVRTRRLTADVVAPGAPHARTIIGAARVREEGDAAR